MSSMCCLLSALVICLRTELCPRAYSFPACEKNLINQNQLFRSTVWMSKSTPCVCLHAALCLWTELARSHGAQFLHWCYAAGEILQTPGSAQALLLTQRGKQD